MDRGLLTLGIETSGFGGSVALVQSGKVLVQRDLDPTGRRHARTLVPETRSLFAGAGKAVRDLDLVAVSIGPGSFTGLRVGVVCAKTLAWAAGVKLIAVDTYLAIAHMAPTEVECVQVVGDGQRGDLYVGDYRRDDRGDWVLHGVIAIRPAEDWLAELKPSDVVTGPGLERHAEAAAARCRVLPRDLWMPRAATIALLGEQRLARTGTSDDIWSLEPFYLRKSGAEEQADTRSK
ncbi:MAG: tRNA (adenosine(37)-N6)-threonylcarbamoyltransferase complex dimerization subunit type 1 TsaB [Planctomycetaceae bacterium]